MLRLLTFSMVLYTQVSFAQSADSSVYKKDNYSFIGVMPLFAGIVTFGQPKEFANVFVPGMSLSYGKAKVKLIFGANVSYRHYFIEGWKDANEYSVGPFVEYHFRPEKKASWLLGLKAYLFAWQYSPQTDRFRFFNDPLDGKSRAYYIPAILPYLGGDFKIRKKYHLVVGAGYDFKFTTRSGVVPFASPFEITFDFRIPM